MSDKTEYVLVPREPTPDMLVTVGTIEGWNEAASRNADACHIEWWQSMLAAAPTPPGSGELDAAGLPVAYAYVVDGECEEIGWGAPPIDDPSTILLYASPALSALPVDHPEVVGVKIKGLLSLLREARNELDNWVEILNVSDDQDEDVRDAYRLIARIDAALRPSDSPALDAGVAVTDAMVSAACKAQWQAERNDKNQHDAMLAALTAALSPTRGTGK